MRGKLAQKNKSQDVSILSSRETLNDSNLFEEPSKETEHYYDELFNYISSEFVGPYKASSETLISNEPNYLEPVNKEAVLNEDNKETESNTEKSLVPVPPAVQTFRFKPYTPNLGSNNSLKTGKINELMEEMAEKEYQKTNKRIQTRKTRVPEILDDLLTAKGKRKENLERELNVLLRKSKLDNRRIRQFELLKNPKIVEENEDSEDDSPKIIRRNSNNSVKRNNSSAKKNLEKKYYERLYKLKAKEVRSRVEEPIKKEYQTKYLMKPQHLAQESGYSSLEDSLIEAHTNPEFFSSEEISFSENQTKELTFTDKKYARSILLVKSPLYQTSFVKQELEMALAPVQLPIHTQNRWEAAKMSELALEELDLSPIEAEIEVESGRNNYFGRRSRLNGASRLNPIGNPLRNSSTNDMQMLNGEFTPRSVPSQQQTSNQPRSAPTARLGQAGMPSGGGGGGGDNNRGNLFLKFFNGRELVNFF